MSDTESDYEMQELIRGTDLKLGLEKKAKSGVYRCTGHPECPRSFKKQVTQAAHCKHCPYARAYRIRKRRNGNKRKGRDLNRLSKRKDIANVIKLRNGTVIRPYKGFNWKDFAISPHKHALEEEIKRASNLIGKGEELRKFDQRILDHYVNVVEFAHTLPGTQKRLIIENLKHIQTQHTMKIHLFTERLLEDPENESILQLDDPYVLPPMDNSHSSSSQIQPKMK